MKKYLLLIFTMLVIFIIPKSVHATTNWEEFLTDLSSDDTIIDLDNDINGNTNINITKDKTINLNGYSISTSGTFNIENSEVNINDGKITSSASTTMNITNGAIVNLNSSTIENSRQGGYAIYIKGTSSDDGIKTKLLIDKNSIVSANFALGVQRNGYASYGVVIDLYGSIIGENQINNYNYGTVGVHILNNIRNKEGNIPEINIYDGSLIKAKEGNTGDINSDDGPAIYAEGYARWNINGGTIEGSEAITAFAGEYNISAGELIGKGKYYELQIESNKSVATGSAIALIENASFPGNIILNISSAKITSEKALAIHSLISSTAKENSINSIKLSGGRYTGKLSAVKIPTYNKFISGGCYSSLPETNYLNSEEQTIIEENTHYCLGVKNKVLVEEKSEKFLQANIKEAVPGQQVTISPKKGFKLLNLKVKTASGKSIEVVNDTFMMPNEPVVIEGEYISDVVNPDTSDNIYLTFISITVSVISLCLCLLKRYKNALIK